jgi:hypothetical protein
MVARGRVQNGVIVPDEGIRLPEGREVTIIFAASAQDSQSHSLLDIPPVSIGRVLRPLTLSDDLLSEMLEGRS